MRRLARVVTAALLCAALEAHAQAGGEGEANVMPCPGALAWNQAHPETSDAALAQRDAARTLTDPALRAELDARFRRDQDARIAWLRDLSDQRASKAVRMIDADDVQWLKALVAEKGFPTAAQVGERGVREAWLLAQHADKAPAFQAALLPVLEQRHASGDLDGSDLARFTDRVLKAHGQPQRYGTQFTPREWAGANFGLPDEASVRGIDANRRALGIMPLADYVCMMRWARREH